MSKNTHTIKRFVLEIDVDDQKCREKYPNYRFNFRNSNDFIRMLVANIGERKMREYGYKVSLKKL